MNTITTNAAIAEGQRDCISMIAEGIIEHLNGEKP